MPPPRFPRPVLPSGADRHTVIAAETRAVLDLNHDFMLKQMVGSNLDTSKLLAPQSGAALPPLPPAPA